MKLYPPIKVSFDTWANKVRPIETLNGLISSESQGFGGGYETYKQFGLLGHNGLDWGLKDSTPIYASHDGVISNQTDYMAGIGCVITTTGFKTIYWHLKSYAKQDGSFVQKGDIIGLSDNTGFSTGPHLHFGLKLLNLNGEVLDRNNGYDGAVDPTSYFVWYDQEDVMTLKEVLGLQALEGYNDPAGAQYWVGKTLQQYLDARLSDKIKTIQLAQ